ncbi:MULTISPECIES: GNAT family N-acetyltransferase [unclassified Undibacterium]|uniref:GNAT family N-acetyltransferase n=1 Tax=unclassified Undibacterium TaxID=2630295 RepID=UPI002AC9A868|nr:MULTISPECIES: GNAT family N-acetyltransferase [unclassified Undibacterium]MEB0139157.1 GNAT family N-acetyltransferase [Undibacterium sp. CCC2.1]MEB0172863.1 GNAT family N-acetyltransferase [Undibacterium sp. CCC1.1]MEB0176665.1 GNAT family N-acetyltransferase [Undibacterium sp. CCC3.4]MEB0216007.1 GNAT family N-acetyltransferase [Undibacterium sp. 5I2]WPX43152.1 GNAT family N-acetyltransferase [Undibacterium sp. CCC3.4]
MTTLPATTRIVLGDWATLETDAYAVRHAVFVVEQQIPVELEWDAMDAQCLHAVAYNEQQEPVGTGRLLPDGHIGRMAVLASARNTGVGAQILRLLMEQARLRGDVSVRLNAQQAAETFYSRAGFARDGEIFMEAGIAHIGMQHRFPRS